MRKVLFFLLASAATGIVNAQVITQNATPNTVAATGSVSCASGATSTNFYTADNSYIRFFKLSDYGINYNYRITNIAFGVQLASKTV